MQFRSLIIINKTLEFDCLLIYVWFMFVHKITLEGLLPSWMSQHFFSLLRYQEERRSFGFPEKKSIIYQCNFSLLLTDLQVIWGVEGLASRWSLLRCWSEYVAAPSHIWMNRDCWWSLGNCVGRCSNAGGGGEAICLDWKNLDVGLFKMDWKKFEYINLALDNTFLYQLDVRLTKMLVAVLQGFLISQPYSTLNVVHFILYMIVETTHKQIFNIFTVAMLNRNL